MSLGIIIATHGPTAAAMKTTLQMITGEQKQLETIGFAETDNLDDLAKKFEQAIAELTDCDSILVLTDIQGGSPFNVALSYQDRFIDIMTGVNIPLLVELALNRDNISTIDDIVNLQTSARIGIARLSELSVTDDDEDF